jgi:17beta-estradiol 17-dehydrogenase / 3beta-hydroxysteroid 3-dehydrogenase
VTTSERSLQAWRGKVALVTGASSGIGRAVATELAAAGMKVAAVARRAARLHELKAAIEAGHPGAEVLPLPCDVRDEAQILAALTQLRDVWGGVDVLVNNAGLGRHAPLLSGATDDWREMLETNVLALCIFTREAVADMRRRGDRGHVVHVSSMAAHRVPLESGIYSATKFAVRALTEGLRRELREADSGIRITAVSPGFVRTEFAEVYHRDRAAAARTYDRYEVLTAEDVASAVVYAIASPQRMQVHDILLRPTRQSD